MLNNRALAAHNFLILSLIVLGRSYKLDAFFLQGMVQYFGTQLHPQSYLISKLFLLYQRLKFVGKPCHISQKHDFPFLFLFLSEPTCLYDYLLDLLTLFYASFWSYSSLLYRSFIFSFSLAIA